MRPTHLRTRYKSELSPRQREVMALIERGLTNPEIADRLGITLDGAKYHVREILGKLGVDSREEAAAVWAEMASSPRSRWGVASLGGSLRIAFAGAIAVFVASVVVWFILMKNQQVGTQQPVAADPSPTVVPPTMTAFPEILLSECVPGELQTEIAHESIGAAVTVAVYVTSNDACWLAAEARLGTTRPPTDPQPDYPAELNLDRRLEIATAIDGRTRIGEWTWENWCPEPMAWVGWRFELLVASADGIISVPVNAFPNIFPPCAMADSPSVAGISWLAPGVSDGATVKFPCNDVGPDVCAFAHSVLNQARAEGGAGIFQRWQSFAFFVQCDGGGGAVGYQEASLCEGAGSDFLNAAWYGSRTDEARLVRTLALELLLAQRLPAEPALELRQVGCIAQTNGVCEQISVVLRTSGGSDSLLQFELESGREPGLRAYFELQPGWEGLPLPAAP